MDIVGFITDSYKYCEKKDYTVSLMLGIVGVFFGLCLFLGIIITWMFNSAMIRATLLCFLFALVPVYMYYRDLKNGDV